VSYPWQTSVVQKPDYSNSILNLLNYHGRPVWFKSLITLEVALQFPFFFAAVYAFQKRSPYTEREREREREREMEGKEGGREGGREGWMEGGRARERGSEAARMIMSLSLSGVLPQRLTAERRDSRD